MSLELLIPTAIVLWLTHHGLRRLPEWVTTTLVGWGRAIALLLVLCGVFGSWGRVMPPYKGEGMIYFILAELISVGGLLSAALLATGYRVRLGWRWPQAFWIALCELLLVSILTLGAVFLYNWLPVWLSSLA